MRSIELLSGSPAARRRHCLERADEAGEPVLWLQRGRPRRPWEGVRQLIHRAPEIVGAPVVREILERHRDTADLLLGTPPAASARPDLPARLDSHLSHNALLKRPFLAECVEILTGLLGSPDVLLVAPDLAELDSETVWLLDKLVQWRPEAVPAAVLGFEPDESRGEPDGRGIVWGPFEILLSNLAFNLGRLPEAERIETAREGDPVEETGAVPARIRDDEDTLTLRAFEALSGEPDSALRRKMIDLVRRAFAGHAFEAALLWGLRMLERGPGLDPLDEAELRNIVALSAHNRQFRSVGNQQLAPFLEGSFRRAYELETRPARKSALGYRLAVSLGRRQDEFDAAFPVLEETVNAARSDSLPEAAATYLEAWALNIRAFLQVRRGHMDRAVNDTEHALRIVDEARTRLPSASEEIRITWERDLLITWSVLVGNRIALARMADDREASELWQRRSEELVEDHPEFELYEAASWLKSYRQFLRYDLALERAERGLELARRERNTLWEYLFLAHMADLTFRLGDVDRAVEACEAAGTFRRDYGNPGVLGSLDLLHAEALGRGGWNRAARLLLQEILEGSDLSSTQQIEAHGLAARLAAVVGDAQAAEGSANQAIDLAVEDGSRDGLVLAAVTAGTACRSLGRFEEARDAYARALDIAGTGEPGDPPPPAADLLEARLGSWQPGGDDPSHVLQALRLLPEALKEPRGWWLLAPLTTAVGQVRLEQPSLLEDPDLAEPLKTLQLVQGQVR